MRFIDQYDVLLFDLMDTLMFGGNRFSETEDYARTYRHLGGTYLLNESVQQVIQETMRRMTKHYGDPAYYNNFWPADQYIAEILTDLDLPHHELARLHDVFACHELGHIPDGHCHALHELARTHRLGIISNLWARKPLFVQVLQQCGIHDLFEVVVFSSDHNSIKPAPMLFQIALTTMNVEPHQALFIGDSVERDVVGATNIGMAVVLATGNDETKHEGKRIKDVRALLAIE
ncbi:MAG TPA: HAD family hydrolase [Hymenobacter sp.]|nr:HAD family hydrolase [Hymenobacter sp.]